MQQNSFECIGDQNLVDITNFAIQKVRDGKPLGGASCACLDRKMCQERATQQSRLLSEVGETAQGSKGRHAEQQVKGEGGCIGQGHPPSGIEV